MPGERTTLWPGGGVAPAPAARIVLALAQTGAAPDSNPEDEAMVDRPDPNLDPEAANPPAGTPVYQKDWNTLPGQVPQRSDVEIRQDIEDKLFRNRDVRSYEVQVQVQGGVVTLSGTVDDEAAKLAAIDACRLTPGVKHCQDNLQTKAPTRGSQ